MLSYLFKAHFLTVQKIVWCHSFIRMVLGTWTATSDIEIEETAEGDATLPKKLAAELMPHGVHRVHRVHRVNVCLRR